MTKPVTIPNTFATATTAIPLSQLDSDFSTVATALNDANTYSNYAADTGVANAYVVTLTGISTTYSAGLRIQFKAGNANTGASTLNVNGGGTKNITFQDASALSSGTIAANAIVDVMYDGTQFLLMNDPAGTVGTGDVVGPAGATANAAAIFDSTTGKLIKDSKVIITPVANSSTLTIANNKTVTVNNTLTLSGTDSTTMTFPSTNATIARTDAAQTFTGTQTFSGDASVNGLTVGRGAGAVSSNTAVGASALAANTTGSTNVAVGESALPANTSGADNTAVGRRAGQSNTTGSQNIMIGLQAMALNTTGGSNTAVGFASLQNNTTSQQNTAVGYQALYNVLPATISVSAGALTNGVEYTITGLGTVNWTSIGAASATVGVKFTYNNVAITGSGGSVTQNVNAANTAIGYGSGSAITTGQKNTIIGAYTGNQGGLDIRTVNNQIVLSDGDGTPWWRFDGTLGVASQRQYGYNNVVPYMKISGFGYDQSAYKVVVLGGRTLSGTNCSLSFGYDPSSNTGASFSGLGTEMVFQNGVNFKTPNSGNTDFFNVMDFDASGYGIKVYNNVGVGGAQPASSGTGITFPATQSASSNANTLDDYEEGTFTATLTPATSGTITLLSNVDLLSYTKIGRLVQIQGLLEIQSVSSPVGGSIKLTTLPFATADLTEYAGRAGGAIQFAGSAVSCFVNEAETILYIAKDASTAGATNQIYIGFSYITS